ARDDLSLAAEGRALRSNNATSMASFFWEQIFCRYGAVIQVVTDNGPEVEGAFKELLKRYRIPQTQISPYNKQANGVVERGHFTIRESLMKICGVSQKHGPLMFPWLSLQIRYLSAESLAAVHSICCMVYTQFSHLTSQKQLS